jgi:hypothetical protein
MQVRNSFFSSRQNEDRSYLIGDLSEDVYLKIDTGLNQEEQRFV